MTHNENPPRLGKDHFRKAADTKMRHLPQQARNECAKIDVKADKLKRRWQARLTQSKPTRDAKEFQQQKRKQGTKPSYSPPGSDPEALLKSKARAVVTMKDQTRLERFDRSRRAMQNKVAQKHGVTLHHEKSLSRKAQFERAAKGHER